MESKVSDSGEKDQDGFKFFNIERNISTSTEKMTIRQVKNKIAELEALKVQADKDIADWMNIYDQMSRIK
jgi:hypothetical protein